MAVPCQEISSEKLHLVGKITPERAKLELKNGKFNHRTEKEFFNAPEERKEELTLSMDRGKDTLAVSLQPLELHRGAEIHLHPTENPSLKERVIP